MNTKNTKYMIISKQQPSNGRIVVNNDPLPRSENMNHLETTTIDTIEIKCRIENAKATFILLKYVLYSHDLILQLSTIMTRCYVFPLPPLRVIFQIHHSLFKFSATLFYNFLT